MGDYIKRDSVIENIISLTTCDSVEEIKEIVYSNFHLKSNEWIGGIYDALLAVGEVAGHDLAVIHCKDCKYWGKYHCCDMFTLVNKYYDSFLYESGPDDFCSRGKRRDEDETSD